MRGVFVPTNRAVEDNVIDETRSADPSSNRNENAVLQLGVAELSRELLRRHGVGDAQIVDLEARLRSQTVLRLVSSSLAYASRLTQCLHVALALLEARTEGAQRLVESRRGRTLLGGQVGVTRGESETVLLVVKRCNESHSTYDRTHGDRYGDVQVTHELLDHDRLQTVLLAEIGVRRLYDVEQLRHHRRHATEETGTRSSLAHAVASLDRHIGQVLGLLGIHHLVGRSKGGITTDGPSGNPHISPPTQ